MLNGRTTPAHRSWALVCVAADRIFLWGTPVLPIVAPSPGRIPASLVEWVGTVLLAALLWSQWVAVGRAVGQASQAGALQGVSRRTLVRVLWLRRLPWLAWSAGCGGVFAYRAHAGLHPGHGHAMTITCMALTPVIVAVREAWVASSRFTRAEAALKSALATAILGGAALVGSFTFDFLSGPPGPWRVLGGVIVAISALATLVFFRDPSRRQARIPRVLVHLATSAWSAGWMMITPLLSRLSTLGEDAIDALVRSEPGFWWLAASAGLIIAFQFRDHVARPRLPQASSLPAIASVAESTVR